MVTYQEFKVVEKKWEVKDTFILKVKPTDSVITSFTPGQYVVIKNPTYRNRQEEHIFSIASSPTQEYLEFCIKVFGSWTKYLSKAVKGDTLFISNPSGIFTWDNSIQHSVFLIGGTGISPIISILRYLGESKNKSNLVLIYCTPSSDLIPYKKELEHMKKKLSLKIVYVFSELFDQTSNDFSGFITKELILREANLKQEPTFFYCGSNSFISSIEPLLKDLKIPQRLIKSEARD